MEMEELVVADSSMNFTTTPQQACSMFRDDPHKCEILIAVKRTTASLSFLGCIFMISVIVLFRKYIVFTQRLILYLSVAAFMDSIAYIMGDMHPDGPLCDFQAFFMTLFDWSVLLWVCAITLNLAMLVIAMKKTEKYEWVYHIVCWVIPIIISCLPFAGDRYGPSGAWCWITEWPWRFGIWYVPLFLIIALLFVVYVYITVVVNRRVHTWEGTYDPDVERNKQMLKEDIKPLRGYPFVYLAVSIFPLINRIQNAVSSDHQPVFALLILHVISSPLHGALNTVVFGMDKDTVSKLTPSQIKLAIQSWRAGRSIIEEFPTETESPDADPDDVNPSVNQEQ
ncbi:cyclic AMP receptor-like protein A [Lingula anatina]|uniref:Cyclic AMP receptor-like protein A n=1 Tax=Lingula anatina TaxID=7574 RepID=A0A1S3KDJ8_LINAN|nr:cyclic AMP receptor-like protein A [Lingula anatina]|eukprot:XP_013420698.1 cyclic AMP receptor-like protein A [Lingula anatina]